MLTLGTQRDLTNDMLIKGIIDSVVTVNQFYQMLPFKGIEGNALAYNREGTTDQMGLVSTLSTSAAGTIMKNAQEFTRHSTELTTIIGDAQVNGLVQAVGSDFHDATAVQVAAKAKGIGRTYMNLLVNGNLSDAFAVDDTIASVDARALLIAARATVENGALVDGSTTLAAATVFTISSHTGTVRRGYSANLGALATGTYTLDAEGAALLNRISVIVNGYDGFDGLSAFVAASGRNNSSDGAIDIAGTGAGNSVLSRLDRYIDSVHDKDGMVDYMMMNSAGVRKITQAFRLVGTGFDMMDVKTSSGGVMSLQSYRGVPIFRNDFIQSVDLAGDAGGDAGNLTTAAHIYMGTMDDGSMTHGICGLTAKRSAGMQVQKLGAREDVDADITRVKWYCGLAHFSELGLVRGTI